MKDLLVGLASPLNIKAEEVSEMFDTEGSLKEGVDPVATFTKAIKTRLDDVYKAAERKTSNRFESWVKSQGVESDLQGTELLEHYFESVKGKPGEPGKGDGGEWEKKYSTLEASHKKALEQLILKDQELEKERKLGHVKQVEARLQSDARTFLGKQWAGSEDHFSELIKGYNPERIRYEGEVPFLLDDNGEILKDELHRPIRLDDDIKRRGKLIGGFHAADPNKGGPPPPANAGGTGSTFTLPKGISNREFNEMLDMEKDPVKKKSMVEARIAQLDEK